MTRNRVTLAYLSNDAARKTTYKKRKKGLAKKVSELTTLCGIEACAVVFSSYEPKPQVWPDSKGAQQVIARFQDTLALDERKNLNQESFTRQTIAKVSVQLKKQCKENREKVMELALFQCVEGESLDDKTIVDLDDIDCLIQKNINNIRNKMDEFV
ncbi:agamous-like MADS-box protein AGL80 [Prosopis cineraria]|uniref:agamous-like MADS-box protein AGL80 n=1 Tax=Prosopis cineraria TaxID=364024 RepID=UPI00240F21FE|nr:agamous-like MADS-box protein AGL80 [Prosopis cineraria]